MAPLPTLERLGVSKVPTVSPREVAAEWLDSFSTALDSGKSKQVTDLLLENALWKDMLALTWDFRTIAGVAEIEKLLDARLQAAELSATGLSETIKAPALSEPYPGLHWIELGFKVETKVGSGTGYARLVPMANGEWKAYTVFTTLDRLRDFPAKLGALRPTETEHGDEWLERRRLDKEFPNNDPTVLIVGGGHSGLETAARLKTLGVRTVVVERKARIGDTWRHRYSSLCLHDPVWYDQTPYIPFPPTWPVYTPAPKLADWLESYANALELNVWTASNVETAKWDEAKRVWNVQVRRDDVGVVRNLTVKHLVFANGSGGNVYRIPDIPGQDVYEGKLVHSGLHQTGREFNGKKAIVVGACNSGHDIAHDFYRHGADVTMVQRSPTFVISVEATAATLAGLYTEDGLPTEVADLLNASFPGPVTKDLSKHRHKVLAETIDKDLLESLNKAGFRTHMGPEDAGLIQQYFTRGGGYYINVGASQLVADGRIKLKAGVEIERFTKRGMRMKDGTELEADIIVCATGFGDPRELARNVCGEEVASKLSPVWGLDGDGELRSVWRGSGHPQLYFANANLALSRFFSTYLALQIKALEEGLVDGRYGRT